MGQLLEVRDVTKSFGSLRALDGVTLDVEEKKVTILIGPNGSGKTTLINVISGFYTPDSGSVFLEGRQITGLAPYPGERFLGALIKRSWLKEETEAAEKAFRILELVGLSHVWDKPATNLSGGQMKLLEIGRALMADARVLLLDEPISGVNPTLAHEIFSKLLKLRDELGLTFFIVEHRLEVALGYVDRIIAMAYGKVLTSGDANKVLSDARVIEAYLGG
ncbi:MAG: ABC transporter ATP-binding protein [Thaumarchaeota archaeon]|nr:MAG: ABC transporter ATP-binding protein [Nitrososphaerota archaeon]